jgi:transposase
LLKSISGIGPLTASALITELGDINRFSHIDDLSSFVGLIPRVRENGETIHTGGITFRCNSFLRTMLIEASWQAIRQGSSSYAILRLHIKAFTPLSIKNDM